MDKLSKEYKGFDKAMNDLILKKEIEEKVTNILKKRKNKEIKEYETKIFLTRKTVKRNKLTKYLNQLKK